MKRFIKLFVEGTLFLIISIPAHEYGHAAMIYLLGGQAVIRYDVRLGVTTILKDPSFPSWYALAALSGGVFIGLIYLILGLIIYDVETSLALRLVSTYHLSYAVVEGLRLGNLYFELIAVICGLIIAMILSRPLLMRLFEFEKTT